jgi:hypothetical protein
MNPSPSQLLIGYLLLTLLASLFSLSVKGEDRQIALIFPNSKAQARAFSEIATGVEDVISGSVIQMTMPDADALPDFFAQLSNSSLSCVIGVTDKVVNALAVADVAICAAGAIVSDSLAEKSTRLMTVSACPAEIFNDITQLSSDIERIHVVIDITMLSWLKALMNDFDTSIQITWYEVDSLESLERAYSELFRAIDPEKEAIWVPPSTATMSRSMARRLYREAWSREILTVSSNAGDAQLGALVVRLPNFRAIGQSLGRIATEIESPHTPSPQCLSVTQSLIREQVARRMAERLTQPLAETLQRFDASRT